MYCNVSLEYKILNTRSILIDDEEKELDHSVDTDTCNLDHHSNGCASSIAKTSHCLPCHMEQVYEVEHMGNRMALDFLQ